LFKGSFVLCSKVQFSTGNVKNLYKDNQLVDFIKIIIKNLNPAILEANILVIFEQRNISDEGFLFPILDKNGEQAKDKNGKLLFKTPYKNAYYNSLEFRIYNAGLITLSGSLHKYWNSGAHNYNDFNLEAFIWVLNDLKHKFNITPEQCILKCLEIGINIIPPIPTNQFLDYCFLHKTKPFEYQKNSDEGKYKQVQHSQYIIKIYNKALHYISKGFDIKGEIMRFEIKYTKMEKLNERGIYNLQDLANYGLHNFKDELLNEFNNILFYDNTIQSKSKSILHYKNAIYWIELLNKKTNDLFNYHRNHLRKLNSTTSQKIQFQTTEIMSNKIDFLNTNTTQIDPLIILSKHVVLTNTIISENILCQVTKINISMQKNDSILLSHTGLKYYYKNDKKVFEQIKRRYLSKRWSSSDFETQIKEIAHNIRNAKSNQGIKQDRIYKPQQVNLLSYLGLE
jgi:hypothetical protein